MYVIHIDDYEIEDYVILSSALALYIIVASVDKLQLLGVLEVIRSLLQKIERKQIIAGEQGCIFFCAIMRDILCVTKEFKWMRLFNRKDCAWECDINRL